MTDKIKVSLSKQNIESIKNKKVTLIKDFINLEKNYDFNFLLDFLEKSDFAIDCKGEDNFFKNNFQVKTIENNCLDFMFLIDFIRKALNYTSTPHDEADFFFSFKSNSGLSHRDREDVFITSLYGKTLYKILDDTNQVFLLEKGDMLHIPKNTLHKVVSISERIVVSIGLFGEQIDNT
jgi:hypothetical protein